MKVQAGEKYQNEVKSYNKDAPLEGLGQVEWTFSPHVPCVMGDSAVYCVSFICLG